MEEKMKRFFHRADKGQSFTELAFVLPILLIMVAGAVDLSRIYLSYMSLRDAAQEGANFGSIAPTETDNIEERVRTYSNFPTDLSDTSTVHVTITTDPNPCVGKQITVKVTQDFKVTTPLIGAVIGQNFPINAYVSNTILSPQCP